MHYSFQGPSPVYHKPCVVKSINLIINPISDHRPTLVVLNQNKEIADTSPKNYFVRDMAHFDIEKFNESLSRFTPPSDRNFDIDKGFSDLQNHIRSCINAHAPLRKRNKKECRYLNKPWISESLQISIDNKNRLYERLQNRHDPTLKRKYNKMKKI